MFKKSGKAGPKLIEATISGLAQGGDAVAKEEGSAETAGRTVFVFGAAPGERVRLRITEEKPRFARGELVEVITASASRRAPQCPLFGRCGGCDWLHLSYEEQQRHKALFVSHALEAEEIADLVPSPEELRYRARTRLHFRREGPKAVIGYFAKGSTTIVDVRECPLLNDTLQDALRCIRTTLAADLSGAGTITLLGEETLAAEIFCETALNAQRASKGVQKKQAKITPPEGPLSSIIVSSPEGVVLQIGAEGVPLLQEEKAPQASGKVFSQANPAVNERLREVVLSLSKGSARILELYAGAGNLTLPLLQTGAQVLAVESDEEAARWLRKNTRQEFAASCEVRHGDSAAISKRLADKGERFDLVVLDPPRAGATPTLEPISRLADRVVYVSCDLSSLARDAKLLQKSGLVMKKAFPFDMFPQSAHVETVAFFERVVAKSPDNAS